MKLLGSKILTMKSFFKINKFDALMYGIGAAHGLKL